MPLPSPQDLAFSVSAAPLSPLPPEPFYRSVDLLVIAGLGVHVLDGTHAGNRGGRYNPPGSQATGYFAGSQTLATLECEQEAMILGLPAPQNPRVTFAANTSGAKVLDLTSALVRQGIGLTLAELTVPTSHWQYLNSTGQSAPTQLLGEAARRRPDCDGLLVPSWLSSVLPPGTLPRLSNLVLFLDPAQPTRPRAAGVSLTVFDPTGLLH